MLLDFLEHLILVLQHLELLSFLLDKGLWASSILVEIEVDDWVFALVNIVHIWKSGLDVMLASIRLLGHCDSWLLTAEDLLSSPLRSDWTDVGWLFPHLRWPWSSHISRQRVKDLV